LGVAPGEAEATPEIEEERSQSLSKTLKISADLSLPLELAARTQCIFAQKGAGKTYAAGVQAEELLGAGAQICVLDPTGVWWGLQSTASGGKGPYEIIVMGGGHGDVPLEPEAGEIIADFLVETGQSVVLDVSQFESQAAQDRFSLALATRLYRLKAHDKANIHIILDEADQFCPLRPQKGQEKMLHAWDLIVRLGRSRGLGLTAISNRPASVHTNIRNNIDLLTCLRVTGLNDFKALKEWTSIHATGEQAKAFLESVPTLPDGEAFFWSPSWLRIFQRAKIRKKHTFDSSRTPKPGERAIEPKARRAPDLTKLTEQINATVEQAKANDPKLLKQELVKLRAEVQRLSSAKPPAAPAPKVETKIVEKPVVTDAQVKRVEQVMTRLEKEGQKRIESAEKLADQVKQLDASGRELMQQAKEFAAALGRAKTPMPAPIVRPMPTAAQRPVVQRSPRKEPTAPPEGGLTGPERRVLDGLAWLESIGIKEPADGAVAFAAKYTSADSSYIKARGSLSVKGMIDRNQHRIVLTESGRAVATAPEVPPTGEELRQSILEKMTGPGRAILSGLIAAYPNALTNTEAAERANYTETDSSFVKARGALRSLGLIEYRDDGVAARPILFPDVAVSGWY
jgi:hypothetical protein